MSCGGNLSKQVARKRKCSVRENNNLKDDTANEEINYALLKQLNNNK